MFKHVYQNPISGSPNPEAQAPTFYLGTPTPLCVTWGDRPSLITDSNLIGTPRAAHTAGKRGQVTGTPTERNGKRNVQGGTPQRAASTC